MKKSTADNKSREGSPEVRWSDVVRFVRQLSHDLRNHLNAIELQAALLTELAEDSEIKGEIKRLRQMISETGAGLQKLTGKLGQAKPNLMRYKADEFVNDLRQKLATDFPENLGKIEWETAGPAAEIEIDPQLFQLALLELFNNAFQHEPSGGSLRVTSGAEDGMLVFALHEPKKRFELSTENWGREPLRSVQNGSYGLGLNRARAIVEAHGGEMRARYDSPGSTLITTITLPIVRSDS